jgi:repressor LexA
MQTVGQIIRSRREALGISLGQLAAAIDVSKSYLSMIENHRVARPPSPRMLAMLERALGITDGDLRRAAAWAAAGPVVRAEVSQLADAARRGRELADWLRHAARRGGQTAKNLGKSPDPRPTSLDALYTSGELARRIDATLDAAGDSASPLDARVPIRFQVPIINRVAAGYPRDFTDLDYPARVADDYLPCPDVGDPQAFAARVVGESMAPDYREGDIVVFSPAAAVEDGCDCFVRLEPNHETTFKRVFFADPQRQTLRLQPLNPRFAPQQLDRSAVTGLYRAVWRLQRL